ncbi:polymer-forming cytoskeletal protein [Desulfurispirillum indicum]|uniref:Polymer-forming cytoskeletal protein n=1 Tax=Desulfurispirillum indicum (strain ATCC BAA-1389 / DSM 22839 / S5) TaxID=653733 RepID=E6W760_DESIS|nr:polymer-forming cytoskeletal protein [Desulfurispirillum indicum]ADU65138.1 protein of unknown function DUF583 [Desulfurispirillum indicum S5]UCZ57041.1 polymer-forming cytoskeletal protein [Desulfurispirillum indicum]
MAIFSAEKESSGNNSKSELTPTVIGNCDTVVGEIRSETDVFIDGKFKGDIYAKKTISVITGGNVDGTFNADKMVISGKVQGVVRANQVVIKSGGYFEGEMAYRILIIEENGWFEGNCTLLKEDIIIEDRTGSGSTKDAASA